MALKTYKCPVCGHIKKSFKAGITCDHTAVISSEDSDIDRAPVVMEEILSAPGAKFMESRDPESKEKGKSILKNQDKILRERARNHSRENELHDLIQTNDDKMSKENKWVNANGEKRKRIDDL